MFDTIVGLPLHPLVVHAIVVLLPLAAVSVLVAAFWPRLRKWAGPLPVIVSVVASVLVPVATQSGTFFKTLVRADQNPAVLKHQALGEEMKYWAIGLVIAAVALYWWHRQIKPGDNKRLPAKWLVIAIMAVAVIASVGTLVHVARVGDSGARATWAGYLPQS